MADIDIKIKETEEEYELIRKKLNEVGGKLRNLRDQKEEESKTEAEKALDMVITLSQRLFATLEGESKRQGEKTIFLRFQACNLFCCSDIYPECHCDSLYSLKESPSTYKTTLRNLIKEIEDMCNENACYNLSITGGEPLIHSKELYWLLYHLSYEDQLDFHTYRFSKYDITIETNGSCDISWIKNNFGKFAHVIGDWKCPNAFGHKANQAMLKENLDLYDDDDALKFVVVKEDFPEVERVLRESKVDKRTNVYISPCWGCIEFKDAVNWILDHPEFDVKLSIQIHKLFNASKEAIKEISKTSADDIWL